jgi:hypothetical protein
MHTKLLTVSLSESKSTDHIVVIPRASSELSRAIPVDELQAAMSVRSKLADRPTHRLLAEMLRTQVLNTPSCTRYHRVCSATHSAL